MFMRVPPIGVLKVAVLGLWLSVTVSGQSGLASLSGDLLALLQLNNNAPVRAIVRGDVNLIRTIADRDRLPVRRVLDGMVVIDAPPSTLAELRFINGIVAISRDALVSPMMTVAQKAMAADQARASIPGGLLGIGGAPAVTGKGVGVAVIDSGIATSHQALAGKVVASINFATGETTTNDGFGHGTHIAGIIGGLPTTTTPLYRGGIAPGAHLINVKVLGAQGSGYTSDVIAGIQWTIANRAKYGIKVVNLSLGHPQVEPCLTDPLCLAVEKAAMAGLVVVASAGNSGKAADGKEAFATITTPGVAPSAITVAALNTWATDNPDDDEITTYSSRGPTRFDLGLKPDVAAPGNKIVSLRAPNSYLASEYPDLHVVGGGNTGYMKMSGTSMAAGMVSGGAALLLENGVLTARQVKLAMQLSARFMSAEGLSRAGLGRVNLYSARRVNNVITTLTGVIPPVSIAGRQVKPSGLMMMGGQPLIDGAVAPAGTSVMGILEVLSRWFDRPLLPSRLSALKGSQMIWGDQLPALQMIWGDRSLLGQQMIWGDLTPFGQQMIWGDQSLAYQMIWGDQTRALQMIWGDQTGGLQMIWGDQTRGLQMIWGDQAAGQQMIWGDQSSGQQMIWGDANNAHANQMIWGDTIRGDGQ